MHMAPPPKIARHGSVQLPAWTREASQRALAGVGHGSVHHTHRFCSQEEGDLQSRVVEKLRGHFAAAAVETDDGDEEGALALVADNQAAGGPHRQRPRPGGAAQAMEIAVLERIPSFKRSLSREGQPRVKTDIGLLPADVKMLILMHCDFQHKVMFLSCSPRQRTARTARRCLIQLLFRLPRVPP